MHLTARNTDIELMDNPDLGIEELKEVFIDINRANEMLGGSKIILKALAKLIKNPSKESYSILDMGCGDGYMLRKVALYLRKHKINAKLIGMDIREDILSIAREASADYPEIEYIKQDVLQLDPEKFRCDILLCTLTMHHFDNDEILKFLRKFVSISSIGVVINDLHRSRLACILFKFFRFFFLETAITKQDGLTSIKSGFLKPELDNFANNIPNAIHEIQWKWAFRYVWIMKPDRVY